MHTPCRQTFLSLGCPQRNEFNYVHDKKNGKLKFSVKCFHVFNFALKAENDLLAFVSNVRLF